MPSSRAAPTRRPPDNLRLERQLCFALYSATHAMTRAYRRALAPVGLTYPQYLVMLALWERDGIGIGEIAATLDLDAATVTPLVKRLEAAGWVARERVPGDDRALSVKVQAKGWALRPEVAEIQRGIARRTGLEAAEFDRLKQSLRELAAQLNRALAPDA